MGPTMIDNDLLFPMMCNIGAAMLKLDENGSLLRIRLQREDCGGYTRLRRLYAQDDEKPK